MNKLSIALLTSWAIITAAQALSFSLSETNLRTVNQIVFVDSAIVIVSIISTVVVSITVHTAVV